MLCLPGNISKYYISPNKCSGTLKTEMEVGRRGTYWESTLVTLHLITLHCIPAFHALKFWFDFCFTALQHILGHFWHGQLPQPHCSWVSLLGSLPVHSAHSFASNWQLLFLNQQKRENGRRNFFMTKSHALKCFVSVEQLRRVFDHKNIYAVGSH